MVISARPTLLAMMFGAAVTAVAVSAPLGARQGQQTGCSKPHETDLDRTLEAVGATPEAIRTLNAESKNVRYIPVPMRVPADSQAVNEAEQRGFALGYIEGEDAVCKKMNRDVAFCEHS